MSAAHQYHLPVLGEPVATMVCTKAEGVIVDGTLGGGGHFDLFGNKLNAGAILIGIDRDPDAIAFNRNRAHRTQARTIIEQGTFSEVGTILRNNGIGKMDGFLLDLGVSSFQIDSAERGFSYTKECDLDMRMNREDQTTARDLIAAFDEYKLAEILSLYGEVRNAARMAHAMKQYTHTIATSADVCDCLNREYGKEIRYKILAKVFMALRIAVNDELGELERVLVHSLDLLNEGGRIAVITYHSLEDRIVKRFFRDQEPHCICDRTEPVCSCGRPGMLKRITRKPITASETEIVSNPRARSARLRVAEKLKGS